MAKMPSREEIELRAYEIYLEHGGQDGNELEHWLAAEKELADRSSQSDVVRFLATITENGHCRGRNSAALYYLAPRASLIRGPLRPEILTAERIYGDGLIAGGVIVCRKWSAA